jgi:two-component system nitrate/nitrite response regulator NarL
MRIVICDDHRLLVEALASAIVRAGHTVSAVAWTPSEGVLAVTRHRPDLLLLDLNFPHGNSLDAARDIVARHPYTRIVMLTGSDSVGPLQEALAIGVAGYLRKHERIDDMLATLERCAQGEQVVDEVLMRGLDRAGRERQLSRVQLGDLTSRELEVADLLNDGLNTAQMVARLGISENTVRTHVQGILNKLAVHSRVEAVALLDGGRPYAASGSGVQSVRGRST